ncbi:MAG: Txe/YoeB family addiction module toxin [Gallionellales bacterium CG_4_10_14_3_um_filter_54_96]|nr:Txe/YoeB family addiction module toxin [Gallionella sp.]OIO75932.1 MAG: addiction module protein [Gallionellaceae bacterium CG1_02_56_997]PIV14775.1 MAG: Txe/YoeB family addiction module toxin [Gallionellales bacterium CG03_land_8_20_14_0_80_55_15]PIY03651.1 MAG: Txe/YoeB family addiction module toxin [Gallionellales bacterium CG_4_10_14_3_um_filter_54_96]PJC03873.1 MAG: Txe/YoeB family addiction module toxin [Gallionellales bacterium CG_4_9_14_0_8_um_filter_55_61]
MARLLAFTPAAWGDYFYWQGQDKKTLKRINQLINEAARSPFEGIGKPEPLRGDLSGFWSRRIDDVNRLVYQATDNELVIIACRHHYES